MINALFSCMAVSTVFEWIGLPKSSLVEFIPTTKALQLPLASTNYYKIFERRISQDYIWFLVI